MNENNQANSQGASKRYGRAAIVTAMAFAAATSAVATLWLSDPSGQLEESQKSVLRILAERDKDESKRLKILETTHKAEVGSAKYEERARLLTLTPAELEQERNRFETLKLIQGSLGPAHSCYLPAKRVIDRGCLSQPKLADGPG
jgi:hypothetical protein